MSNCLELALRVARSNPIDRDKPSRLALPAMSAVLIYKDQLFIGINRRKTHPLQKRFGKNDDSIYLHAEIDAIVQATRSLGDITGSKLFVARVNRKGQGRLARPCCGCQRAIVHFGITEVQWTGRKD